MSSTLIFATFSGVRCSALLDGGLKIERRSGIEVVTLYAILMLARGLLADDVAGYLRFLDALKHVVFRQ